MRGAPPASVFLVLAALIAGGPSPAAAGAAWSTDFDPAVARATALRRPLLVNFTGSDWCDWCQSLKAEVFDTPEFAAWSEKTVVLVEVDFPRNRSLEAALQAQNERLARRFAALLEDGYPTVILLDPAGERVIGDLGYLSGGPGVWTEAADHLLARPR